MQSEWTYLGFPMCRHNLNTDLNPKPNLNTKKITFRDVKFGF